MPVGDTARLASSPDDGRWATSGEPPSGVPNFQAITRALSLAEPARLARIVAIPHNAYGWMVHTDEVGGSSPLPPTNKDALTRNDYAK